MNWYRFIQNNTGGQWKGPAMIVGIEAHSIYEAIGIAQEKGLYFDSCEKGVDCACCGDRWHNPFELSREEIRGYFDSNRYGTRDQSIKWSQRYNIPMIALYALDGTSEIVTPPNYEVTE